MKELIIKNKKLVLSDLSARLSYRVIVDYAHNAFDVHKGNYIKHESKCILTCDLLGTFIAPRQNDNGEYIKAYLRPLSSMTEDERKELSDLINKEINGNDGDFPFSLYDTTGIKCNLGGERFYFDEMIIVYDWLNAHHFDYRGLIEKGLAIKVTEDNNPYNI